MKAGAKLNSYNTLLLLLITLITLITLLAMGNEWQEVLIEGVRQRRVLWDKTHKDYKDGRTIKKNNWDDVAKEVSDLDIGTVFTGEEAVVGTNSAVPVHSPLCF